MERHRILIIDDDRDICTMLKMALSKEYEVVTAYDGFAGLQKIQGCEPDLVMLDVKMPKVNGHQLCEAIKHSRKTRTIRVIFITGYGSTEDEFAAFKEGADLYIRKPFDIDRIVQEIEGLLAPVPPSEKTLSYHDIQCME